jgi:hypothetical protein
MFPDVSLASQYDALAASICADIAERRLVARAWWKGQDAWAAWSRTPKAAKPVSASASIAETGGPYDTLSPSFFDLQSLRREAEAAAEAAADGIPAGSAGGGDGSPIASAGAGVPVSGRPNACGKCGEPFATRFHETTGDVWYADAVETETGVLMHPACFALHRRSSTGSSTSAIQPIDQATLSVQSPTTTGQAQSTSAASGSATSPVGSSPSALGAAGL